MRLLSNESNYIIWQNSGSGYLRQGYLTPCRHILHLAAQLVWAVIHIFAHRRLLSLGTNNISHPWPFKHLTISIFNHSYNTFPLQDHIIMETEAKTTPCSQCNKPILTTNLVLHQLRCPGAEVSWSQLLQQSSLFPKNRSKHSNGEMDEKKVCPDCHKQFSPNVYSIHEQNCEGPIDTTFFKRPLETSEIVQMPKPSIEPKISFSRPPQLKRVNSITIPMQDQINNCVRCGQKVKATEMDYHTQQCMSFDIRCEYCNEEYPALIFQEHVQVCQAKKFLEKIQNGAQEESFEQEQFPQFDEEEQQGGFGERLSQLRQSVINLYNGMLDNEQIQVSQGLTKAQLRKIKKMRYKRGSKDVDQCSICFVQFENKQKINQLNCRHLYHMQCIGKWLELNSLCPLCKKDARK